MGIGYAVVNSISFNITGEVNAKEQNEIFITEIKCFQQDGYDNSLCNTNDIQSSYQTSVHSKIKLDNSIDSTITYQITVLNNSDVSYYFDETIYLVGDNTFSNQNITFELKTEDNTSEFLQNTEVPSKTYTKFNLIFKYKDNADILNNDLESLLNFNFYRFYNLSFDAKEGTVDLSNKNIIYGKKYGELPTPIRKNYNFDGWFTEKENGELIEETSIVNIKSDHTLYAHWSLEEYTITYNIDDRFTIPYNPTTYNREDSFTINNPILNRLGYRIGWDEEIYTTNWYNGFINLVTGAYEEYNINYPNAVFSEKLFLKAGVTYTITGIGSGLNRWRFFDTNDNYVENNSSLTYTPSIDGYVIILLHNGADETTRNNIRIKSSHGETITINKGSTGNRIYNFVQVPTKVVVANIFDREEVTINGDRPKVNSDGSVSFDSSKTFNNMIVKLPQGDYSKGVTIALDVYLTFPNEYIYTGDLNEVQTLLMARTSTNNSVFLFQWQSKMHWDLGDASEYRNVLDKELTKTGRYLFLISYGPNSTDANKTIIINKSTNKIIYNKTDNYSLESLNSGISLANNELQIGGDYYKTNGYPYDAEPQTKFYAYFFDNIVMTNEQLENMITEFGYGTFEIS